MLFTKTKKNTKREIRLSRHEQDSMIFDENYYFQAGKFNYTIGLVPEPRLRKMVGRKDTYYIVKYNEKDVKFVEKVHDLTTAQFELSWAMNSEFYNQMFAEMRRCLKPDNHHKNVMNKEVSMKGQQTEKTLTELGILSGIVAGTIDTTDLDKSDIEQFISLETKRSIKRAKKDKPRVIIIPESLPEMFDEWNLY